MERLEHAYIILDECASAVRIFACCCYNPISQHYVSFLFSSSLIDHSALPIPVTYHNWRHALGVAQCVFAMLIQSDLRQCVVGLGDGISERNLRKREYVVEKNIELGEQERNACQGGRKESMIMRCIFSPTFSLMFNP